MFGDIFRAPVEKLFMSVQNPENSIGYFFCHALEIRASRYLLLPAGQIEYKMLAAQAMTKLKPGGSQAIFLYRENLS